jgi:hypothetical protein
LEFPDFDKQFVIQCDASKTSIGGVCLQAHLVNGKIILKPVMFFGRKLTATEQRYSTTEREMLAIVYGYLSCYHLVYGRKIIFGTDHKPLVTLSKLKRPFDRLGRLLNHLMGVDYTLEFIPGHLNYLADFMSRAIIQGPALSSSNMAYINVTSLVSSVDWILEQKNDSELVQVMQCVSNNSGDREWLKCKNGNRWLRERKFLYIFDGILHHGASQKVVPSQMVVDLLKLFHDNKCSGHRAFGSTLYALSCRYFWLRMFSSVKEYCQSCELCQKFNYANLQNRAPLKSIGTHRPAQLVQLDFMGPFTTSKAGNRYICLAVDAHIKFLWYAATKTIDEISTALFLFNEVICKVGPVEQIMSDRGANFESNVFVHFCRLFGSKKVRSSAFHPASNGGIEIVNKVIKPNLAKYVANSHDDWDICLGLAVNSYNNTLQSSIGMAPSEALFNRPPVLMADVICNNRLDKDTNIDNVSEYTLNLWHNAQRVRQVVSFNKSIAQEKQREMYDRFVKDSRKFEIGDLVKIKSYKKKTGVCAAFQEKFSGPLKIINKFGDVTFKLQGLDGNTETVHYNRLAPFYARNEEYNFGSSDVVERETDDNDVGVFYSNLNNLTGVVFHYKAKLRRRAACMSL